MYSKTPRCRATRSPPTCPGRSRTRSPLRACSTRPLRSRPAPTRSVPRSSCAGGRAADSRRARRSRPRSCSPRARAQARRGRRSRCAAAARPRARHSGDSRRGLARAAIGVVRRALGDALDAGLWPGVEDGRVLGLDDSLRRGVQRVEVDVLGAAVARAQLRARHREARAQLDQRQHDPTVGFHAFLLADVRAAPRARGSSPTAPSRAARRSPPAVATRARAAGARAPPRRSASSPRR